MRFRLFLFLASLATLSLPASAQLPARDLVLELRQVEDGGAGYTVSTRPQTPLLPLQRVQVRNGETARVSYSQSVPLQWVESVQAQGQMAGAGVKQRLIWLQAGQSLQLKPQWKGGQQPVRVEVQLQTAAIEPQPEGGLPAQQRSELVTTVQAPLGQWLTLARSGQSPQPGVYSSDAVVQRPRLLQLRVSTP